MGNLFWTLTPQMLVLGLSFPKFKRDKKRSLVTLVRLSVQLKTCEKRYCVTRRELLAIVRVCKHFHHYLYGQEFKIRTDHGSSRWLLKFKNPEGQIARWIETLSSYQFLIEHRAGRSHQNADALSRRPCIGDYCKHCLKIEDMFCPVTDETSGIQVLAIQGNNSNPSTHSQPENDSTCNTTQNDILYTNYK